MEQTRTKVIDLSVDGVAEHKEWKKDIESFSGAKASFPIIADESLAAANSTRVRVVFIIRPDKKLQLSMTYPMSVGRNFTEVLRALDALQASYDVPIAMLANWTV